MISYESKLGVGIMKQSRTEQSRAQARTYEVPTLWEGVTLPALERITERADGQKADRIPHFHILTP